VEGYSHLVHSKHQWGENLQHIMYQTLREELPTKYLSVDNL
jgi:hypothetical protein